MAGHGTDAVVSGARLSVASVGKTYADGTEALREIHLHAGGGEVLAIVGGSGCGKTTLLRLIAGLDRPSGGVIRADASISAVFQEPRLLPWLDVGANIAFGGRRLEMGERRRRTEWLLGRIGLAGYGRRLPKDLSGGQQQRVAIARALIGHPEILLMDEPFSALDAITRGSLHELVLALWQELEPTIVMVTHDVDEAVVLADRVVVMRPRPGRVLETLAIDLPRPRDRLSPAFDTVRRNVLRAINRSLAGEELECAGSGRSPWV